MRTLNKKYNGDDNLTEFIYKNNIVQEKNILLQVFTGNCDLEFIENLVSMVKTLIPHINIIGCTTSGEILDNNTFENSTILSFSLFEKTTISTYFTEVDNDSYKTAQNLIAKFDDNLHPKVIISFADGLNVNGEEYINAFTNYNNKLIITGGLSGDNAKFIRTIVFTQDEILVNGAVAALLFNDSLIVKTKASFGWESIGKTMIITKSIKNVVYEIDNIKIVDIYAKYLGADISAKLPKTGIEFPLIIKRDGLNVPRAVIGKNDDESLVFAGNLDVGERVTFGYGNIEAILDYGNNIYNDINIQNSESIFVYSCMARKALMPNNIAEELTPLCNISSISGFFTYGEFYSYTYKQRNELLNQTMTILSLNEKTLNKSQKFNYELLNTSLPESESSNNETLKALSHLISQTSKELEDMNSLLKSKVEREVEKNRKKDKQIMQQSRLALMGEMLSMIAHQWRQPLAAISSTSAGINLKARLNKLDRDTAIELSDKITGYSQHLSSTIDDFRDFFKSDSNKINVTCNEVIRSVLNIVEISISNNNIELIVEENFTDNFYTHPNKLKQVILNLIKNAEDILLEKKIKKPFIKISTFKRDNNMILEIRDNGGGIPDGIQNKIYDPYFSTKTEKDGTGLGLYMSRIIIQEHCDGIINASNDEDGAVFCISIPLSLKK